MRLKDTEVDSVIESLVSAHVTAQALRAWLAAFKDVSNAPTGANVSADARILIDYLDKNSPDSLLTVLLNVGANNADIAAIAERYRGAISKAPNGQPKTPWTDRFLFERTVFLDRRPLRLALAALVSPGRTSTIVVRGPTRSGKTFTAELIRHVADQLHDKFAHVASASTAGVSSTVERILAQLGEADYKVERIVSPDSHWYNQQCTRILAAADKATAERCWVVIDRMGNDGAATVDFCDYLVEAAATSITKLRVVLLGYPRSAAPDTVPGHAVEWEDLSYGHVVESDVLDFVEWLYREIVQKPLTNSALASEVQGIIAGRVPTQPDFLESAGKEIAVRARNALSLRGSP
jgi:hypothetical protein